MKIILASKSPRRKELMTQVGLEFTCVVSDKEEKIESTIPREVVLNLSKQKAEDVYELVREECSEEMVIVGADTVVAFDDVILGKPKDREDAKRMLKNLRGRSHSVWTGVTLIYDDGGKISTESFAEETKVYMYNMSDEEIDEYVESGEPDDKAGAYAIQGLGARFVEKIEGDYNNVVGLPIGNVYRRIKREMQDK